MSRVIPPPPFNLWTRAGNPNWIRVGFVQAVRAHELANGPEPHCDCSKCKRKAKGARVFTRHAPPCCGCQDEPCLFDSKYEPCHCAECEKHADYRYSDEVACKPVRRYPLYGRLVDYGRNLWEYHALDTWDDVRVPVGVPRNKNELYDGDLVKLQGDPRDYRVSLTELDDYYNFSQLGYRFPRVAL